METKELIGLDVGMARTGVARASMVARLAEPLTSVETDKLMAYLAELAAKQPVDAVVVGLPRNLQGDDTKQTEWVRQWVDRAKEQLKATFYWQDEALTSKVAESRELRAKTKVDEHAVAAAIILQDFLDTPEANRTVC